MSDVELAVAILVVNVVAALVLLSWCNKKTKDLTDKDNWK